MDLTFAGGFDLLFDGTGYITIGYYKKESDTLAESVLNMTARVAEISGMNSDSHVLDLGCGRGRPVLDIAVSKGCSVVGVDLSDGHIAMAKEASKIYAKEKKPDIKAEFYAASYFELPEAVTSQNFTHVMMQTSMFYAHHRIDEILGTISKVLRPGGILVTTDFLRVSDTADLTKFMEMNSMPVILSLDEMKAAFLRNGLEYCGGEDLDHHCIKCNAMKAAKVVQENIVGPSAAFFNLREEFVREKKVSFQIVMAKKI